MNRRGGWLVQAGLGALFAVVTPLVVPGGVFIVLAVVLFLVVRGAASRSGRRSGTRPDEVGRAGAGGQRPARARASVAPVSDVADRLSRLAGELAVPGGRSNDEVMREAAEVYAQLPAHVRAELEERAPEDGLHVEVSGPVGPALARLMGLPTGVVAPGPPALSAPPSPAPPAAPASAPAAAPTATTLGRGIVAPSELSGYEVPLSGSVPEGWYRTPDGSRERWYDGTGWTARVRPFGTD